MTYDNPRYIYTLPDKAYLCTIGCHWILYCMHIFCVLLDMCISMSIWRRNNYRTWSRKYYSIRNFNEKHYFLSDLIQVWDSFEFLLLTVFFFSTWVHRSASKCSKERTECLANKLSHLLFIHNTFYTHITLPSNVWGKNTRWQHLRTWTWKYKKHVLFFFFHFISLEPWKILEGKITGFKGGPGFDLD